MDEKALSMLVLAAVLLVAVGGMYVAFTMPQEVERVGKSIEGARMFYEAHRPYEYGSMQDVMMKVAERPLEELPAAEYWTGFCALMINERSPSIIPVPVPRYTARSLNDADTVSELEDRGYVILKVIPASDEYICPQRRELPKLADVLEEMGIER